jgi:hypothetical protein
VDVEIFEHTEILSNMKEETSAWSLATGSELLLKLFGEYPSFHDAMVRSVCIERAKRLKLPALGTLFDPRELEFVDVIVELKHRQFRSREESVGQLDYGVTVALLDVVACDIDVNAMLTDSFVSEITLSKGDNQLFMFDLEPNAGLSMQVECAGVEVRAAWPYPALSPFDTPLP